MTLIIASVYVLNPEQLSTPYGTGNGRWVDRIDSYSDYLVRNTVKNDILGHENQRGFLIITKTHRGKDFTYASDGTQQYLHQFALQARVLSILARHLPLHDEARIDYFLDLARAAAAAVSALLLALFMARLTSPEGPARVVATLFLAAAAGMVYYSPNLYFFLPTYLAPLGWLSVYHGRIAERRLAAGLVVLAMLNFLCRYEFATVYLFLCLLPTWAFAGTTSYADKLRQSLRFAGCVVAGLLAAMGIHTLGVAHEIGASLPAAAHLAFETVVYRTQTVTGVPLPFSEGFFALMRQTCGEPAFVFPGLHMTLTKIFVLLVSSGAALCELHAGRRRGVALYVWGLLAYASWYVGAYQHIMWHRMYDSFLFTLTVGLVFVINATAYTSSLWQHLQAWRQARAPIPTSRCARNWRNGARHLRIAARANAAPLLRHPPPR